MSAREPVHLLEVGAAPSLKDAAGLRMRLLDAIDQHRAISVDLSRLEDADISLIQLLLAAGREATRRGQRFSLSEPPRGALLQSLQHFGLLPVSANAEPLSADTELWFGYSQGEAQ